MAVASGIYTDPYLVRMQYATYAPIWEGGGRFLNRRVRERNSRGVSDGTVFWGGFSGLAGLLLCDYWLLAP